MVAAAKMEMKIEVAQDDEYELDEAGESRWRKRYQD